MQQPGRVCVHRPSADRQAVPDPGRAAASVRHSRRADAVASTSRPTSQARRRARATATEMQMLSQRLARGTALAVQGNAGGVRKRQGFSRPLSRRPRCADQGRHRSRASTSTSPTSEPLQNALRRDHQARWERVEKNATTVIDNQPSLLSLSKGLDGINQGNNALLELAQQASAQIALGRRLAARGRLHQSARRALAADREERQFAGLVGRNRSRGRVPARQGHRHVPRHPERAAQGQRRAAASGPVRNDEARATLTELQKRFAGVRSRRQRDPAEHAAAGASPSRRARGINQESEPLLDRHDQARPTSSTARRPRAAFTLWAGHRLRRRWRSSVLVAAGKVFSATTVACARSKASRRTSATRRRFCGC